MRTPSLLTALLLLVLSFGTVSAQAVPPQKMPSGESIESIAANVASMSANLENLNRNWYTFFKTFSSDKGGEYFTDNQKRLLFALEVLNRYEKNLATSQTLQLDLIERQSKIRMQLAAVTDNMRPESVDRFTVWRGTTDAEAIRDIRRQALQKEQRELSSTLNEIASALNERISEMRRTEMQIRNIRAKIFGEIDKELATP